MQIRTEKVKLRSKEIKRIYFEAFPRQERMPFFMMVAMSKLWNTQFLSFYDGDEPCGLIYLAHNKKLVFVMFLAVEQRLRSKGYGSSILQHIQSIYPNKKIIISIEPCEADAPDIQIRQKRKAFYLRNGYQESSYTLKLNGLTQEIIIANGTFQKSEFRAFFTVYSFGAMYPKIWKQTV